MSNRWPTGLVNPSEMRCCPVGNKTLRSSTVLFRGCRENAALFEVFGRTHCTVKAHSLKNGTQDEHQLYIDVLFADFDV